MPWYVWALIALELVGYGTLLGRAGKYTESVRIDGWYLLGKAINVAFVIWLLVTVAT